MAYIHGPAVVQRGSDSWYFEDGLNLSVKLAKVALKSDMHGTIGEIIKSRSVVISGTPVGMIRSLSSIFPYGVADIGNSIFGASATPLTIWTKAGKKFIWARSGLSKSPTLKLGAALPNVFSGAMEWTCLGKADEAVTAAGHWHTASTAALVDTTFDQTLLKRLRYSAAFGSAPYNAMTALDGFDVDLMFGTEEMMDDSIGLADIAITDITAAAKFKPSALTEEEMYALIKLQDTGALDVGDWVAKAATDLVITGSGSSQTFVVTLKNAGAAEASALYETGKFRQGEVAFGVRRTWTTGAPGALWTLATT